MEQKEFSFHFVSSNGFKEKYFEMCSNIIHSLCGQISLSINNALENGILETSGTLNSNNFIPGRKWEFPFEACSAFVDTRFIGQIIGNNLLKSGWKLLKLVIKLEEQKFDFIIEPIIY